MAWWVLKRDGNDMLPGVNLYAWQSKVAGPFNTMQEADKEARRWRDTQDGIIRATQDPKEMEISYTTANDEHIAEMRSKGVTVYG